MSFRIATVIVVALFLIQAINFAFFQWERSRETQPFALGALVAAIGSAAEKAFAAPFQEGELVVEDPQIANFFSLRQQRGPVGDERGDARLPLDLRLLSEALRKAYPSVQEVRFLPGKFPPVGLLGRVLWGIGPGPAPLRGGLPKSPPDRPSAGAPGDPMGSGAPQIDQMRVWLPGPVKFALRGAEDDRWIVVQARSGQGLFGFQNAGTLIWLLLTVLCVFFVSQFFARRESRPLLALVEAAERIGQDRTLIDVDVRNNVEVAVLSDALNRMQKRIQNFIDERTLMLGALSHDLRTPLTRMRLAATRLDDKALCDELVSDIEEMQMMVEATLRFARDETVDEPRRPIDLAVLCMSLCDDLCDRGGEAEYHGVERCIISGKSLALKRALANLIENAWRYGGKAHVDVRKAGDAAQIEISDNGPGIPSDQYDEAFAPFRRLETLDAKKPGSGLGLTIARDVVLSHGGEIRLAPNTPSGLKVTIILPGAL